jgi:hypothetical protein
MPMIGGHHRLAVGASMNEPAAPYIPIHEDCFDFANVLARGGSKQLVRDLSDCFLGGKSIPLLHGRRRCDLPSSESMRPARRSGYLKPRATSVICGG